MAKTTRLSTSGTLAAQQNVQHPWAWIALAINPLFIVNGVHTIDFYIKALWIGLVLALALFFGRMHRDVKLPYEMHLPELAWILYMIYGSVAMFWSPQPILGFERLVYYGYGIAGYFVAKRTKFWEYDSFWMTYVGTALVVGLIGMCMWLFSGTALGFDWIMSAGRPSSTLSYRAYAGTYMTTTLPFLVWYMFSKHVRTPGKFAFAAASFLVTFCFMVYTRARSAWVGTAAAFGAMILIWLMQKRWNDTKYLPHGIITIVLTLAMAAMPANKHLLETDANPQKLRGTGKENALDAASTIVKSIKQSDRFDFWDMSRKMLFEKSTRGQYEGPAGLPAAYFGVGIGQFPCYVPVYSNIVHLLGAEIHNDWIQAYTETGPIGFLCWMLLPAGLLYLTWTNREKGLMVACMGGVLAWIFSTQTDFLTPRIYGMLWVGGIAAIVLGNAPNARVLFRFNERQKDLIVIGLSIFAAIVSVLIALKMDSNPNILMFAFIAGLGALTMLLTMNRQDGDKQRLIRFIGGLFFVWISFSYAVTMWCDRQIYTALLYGRPTVDNLVDILFRSEFPSMKWGIGKYLIYQPITDLAKVVSDPSKMKRNDQNAAIVDKVQQQIAEGIYYYHPLNHQALLMMADVAFRQKNYKESLKYNDQYVALRPNDWNMWLFRSQTTGMLGDSVESARSAYKAYENAPDNLQVQQWWMMRVSEPMRERIVKEFESKEKK